MLIENWPIDKPKPYSKNARKWSAQAVEKVAMSLKEYGWRQPIVVDTEGVIVIGHLRQAAGKHAGFTECPVHVARELSPAQIRGLRLADNRTHEEALWDEDMLKIEFSELKAIKFDIGLTAFDLMRVDQLLYGTEAQYAGMPEFNQDDLMPWQTLKVHFRNQQDRESFGRLISQALTESTKFVWHPRSESVSTKSIAYSSAQSPRYPVYIVSKGRWESRLTSKTLEEMNVDYRIVIEPQEFEQYAAVIDSEKILVLPFSNLGQGSIPARNWIWEHAIAQGAARHWILDDNIRDFFRLVDNQKIRVRSGVCFAAIEDFVDRYENVALAGMNYQYLAKRKQHLPPFVANTRIYSCILIKNELKYRWRGRYNEDTDLSLRALKDGWCTVQFNAFLSGKVSTLTMKGGNTDELYAGDGRLKMAESLREQHPDVVEVVYKWGRAQHQVDYRPFKNNKFILKPGFVEPTEANNYGMELVSA